MKTSTTSDTPIKKRGRPRKIQTNVESGQTTPQRFVHSLPSDTKIFALGGMNEVGKNMYCFEHEDEIIVVDSGVLFPEDELLVVDYVVPDYSYLVQNREKFKALIITHAHEDHIGGIPIFDAICRCADHLRITVFH